MSTLTVRLLHRYGKRGISWMMNIFNRVIEGDNGSSKLATQAHACVLSDESKQDSECVLALIKKSLELYKLGHPEVKEIFIRSDNGMFFGLFGFFDQLLAFSRLPFWGYSSSFPTSRTRIIQNLYCY